MIRSGEHALWDAHLALAQRRAIVNGAAVFIRLAFDAEAFLASLRKVERALAEGLAPLRRVAATIGAAELDRRAAVARGMGEPGRAQADRFAEAARRMRTTR